MQTHGGFAFAQEYDIERKWREVRLYQTAPISTNLMLAYVGAARARSSAFLLRRRPCWISPVKLPTSLPSLKPSDLPDRCREAARIGIVDCVGVMIAGAAEQPVRIVSPMLAASTQNDGAPEIPAGRNLAASDAALVNGVAAHVLRL